MIQEVNNKYYDLVISLIKKHKKYNDCIDIVEDIAKDVLEHLSIVVENIKDDSIVENYLKKTVANSMITVPRKLNINTRKSNVQNKLVIPIDDSSNLNTEFTINTNVTQVDNAVKIESTKQEYIDKMINSADSSIQDAKVSEIQDAPLVSLEEVTELEQDCELDNETLELNQDESFESLEEVTEFEQDCELDNETIKHNNNIIKDLCHFEPSYSNEEMLAKEFLDKLLIKNTKQPELKLYKLWKLKFKDKLTITEIANRLHKDKDEILTSLKKIIDLAEK